MMCVENKSLSLAILDVKDELGQNSLAKPPRLFTFVKYIQESENKMEIGRVDLLDSILSNRH